MTTSADTQHILVFSGKKQSGKSSGARFLIARHLNKSLRAERFYIDPVDGRLIDKFSDKVIDTDVPSSALDQFWKTYNVKMYSFADPLKRFLIETLNLDISHCYGTDEEKNCLTHIVWESIPTPIRNKYRIHGKRGRPPLPTGPMSGREVMQVFGTDICRAMDAHCWARLYNMIRREGHQLAIVCDARFPNEVTIGAEHGAKVIRLLRDKLKDKHVSEHALDNMPHGEYSLVVDNENMTMPQKNEILLRFFEQVVR